MKTLIIYASKNGASEKVAKALTDKIRGEAIAMPIARAKSACLLKYDFVIFGGSIHYGHIQGDLKRFINKNIKTILGMNYGLYIMCMFEDRQDEYMKKEFGEEILASSFISDCFGAELNPNEGNFLARKLIKANLKEFEKEGKEAPSIRWERVDAFANKINERIHD